MMTSSSTPDDTSSSSEYFTEIRNIFASHFERLRPQLINLAISTYNLSHDDAEDCIHEAWMRCEYHVESLAYIDSPESWITKTFKFCCEKNLSSQKQFIGLDRHDSGTDTPAPLDTLLFRLGKHQSPPDFADGSNHPVWDAIRRLPRRQMLAVLHRFVMGESYDEIARIMNCEPATVRSLIRNAMPSIRKFICTKKRSHGSYGMTTNREEPNLRWQNPLKLVPLQMNTITMTNRTSNEPVLFY